MTEAWFGLDPRASLAIHVVAAMLTVAAVLGVAKILRTPGVPKDRWGIYESGAPADAAANAPVPTAYFQIAAFFVIFDFEAAVLYTWALTAAQAGAGGLMAAGVFIIVLLVALAYLWLDGALDVGARPAGGAKRGQQP
ncbi:NADH ubiquinone oxidoreductase chain A [Roseibacterium elongatum DSM 19469]|uniref:NADH-quinone oxidoreductase subunit n=1 Tax=Roseicyclus elongatus DSM 19469 TaxID=1294273 RepID=W8RN13_9RHOB|nr:NADH-quinone oxidoreductase subunit A [Roseibacterium elongatum]AHM02489.1 NADH ubiquinone oxidoreductase chain A [Roseibacterium elongatum DSM 19469]